ncbi:hypothetical protein MUN81_02700 [Hymenobacter sp. 5317J-9]|uniref:hypothetical protein n=1 Tax=Hymenobacter sp. 5317J-9 TaxID=2932250 RepID=UPI001FD6F32B|nr:hypothetical protein [Hymenobacter sp. 5317J-9]UOQ98404.1 hypothetical protein MUN81_02700 [Hymenobacter sp. 5317J-9]
MLNLLWSALNVVLLGFIFYILYRAARLVKQHMGNGALLGFVLALFVIGGRSADASSEAPRNLLAQPPQAPIGNASSQQEIALGGSNTLTLLSSYRSNNGHLEPLSLYTTVSGIVLGHRWKPIGGMLHEQGSRMQYEVTMQHEWRLLGMQVYGQIEEFRGVMPSPTPP